MKRIPLTLVLLVAWCLPALAADESKAKPPSAAELLATGSAQAKKENKQVFLIFGSPSCGWCRLFEKYHADSEVARVTGKHIVMVKVDVEQNAGGEEMYHKYGTARGVPAFTFLDAEGKVLADSGDGEKNVGFPFKPEEVAHYFAAFKKACPKLTDDEVKLLTDKLKEFGPKQ